MACSSAVVNDGSWHFRNWDIEIAQQKDDEGVRQTSMHFFNAFSPPNRPIMEVTTVNEHANQHAHKIQGCIISIERGNCKLKGGYLIVGTDATRTPKKIMMYWFSVCTYVCTVYVDGPWFVWLMVDPATSLNNNHDNNCCYYHYFLRGSFRQLPTCPSSHDTCCFRGFPYFRFWMTQIVKKS
jgi:hypothetical protein